MSKQCADVCQGQHRVGCMGGQRGPWHGGGLRLRGVLHHGVAARAVDGGQALHVVERVTKSGAGGVNLSVLDTDAGSFPRLEVGGGGAVEVVAFDVEAERFAWRDRVLFRGEIELEAFGQEFLDAEGQALRGFLPDEIITKKKHGFGLPFGVWAVKHPGLSKLAKENLDAFASRGVIRPAFIRELQEKWLPENPGYYGEMVWIILMLEQWLQAYAPDWKMEG